MSVTLTQTEFQGTIEDHILAYWEEKLLDNGYNTLEEMYADGIRPREADKYLLALGDHGPTFTYAEIDELKNQLSIIDAYNYPDDLKEATVKLYAILKDKYKISKLMNSKGKNQAIRGLYERTTGESGAPGHGPANLIRQFSGIKVPKRAEGGKRSRKTRKLRKSKKTRKN